MAIKVKNVSKKIISIGETLVLPDEVVTLPAKFEKNNAVNALVKLGFLKKSEDKSNAQKNAETAKAPETATPAVK